MTLLAAGLLGLIAWWYWSRSGARGLVPGDLLSKAPGWVALALALICVLRGRLDFALVLGAGALWFLEGPAGIGRRLRGLFGKRSETGAVAFDAAGDGAPLDGTVRAGSLGGRRLSSLTASDIAALRAGLAVRDPAAARGLEAYLDRRHPGWREHAERDRDPRARRPAQPGAMTQEEAYQVLGLERGASPESIRAAHRALMKRIHPDQGGSAERAARVNAARDRLTDRHR
ncbi:MULTISPECIES: DnaJ domain-containing protein [Methylobacterium]|uniref:Chaperone protein DnaJ n=1 Tax=Methylobacterium jeotgali TaxID=381630 RepID=A0ABQ4SZ08_9HYPH|nr:MULTISPECIES: DnaJ domain-containing protein [Methylobacterium]PIU07407.1 MAG: molecular chaperone DnaJ [Methylobacterium sp. CG09_land_8_20_14_0_10_71_15]PIU13943.1 MAG: molecular chaperone DnaJ [Methylobacterium sp. CG08_land_8_20_14_0_20_71_15]GBU17363.1 molecular chaperone DnaJ [Methylobacterium sp.]GJE07708.1 Chaperone protein DnaJ [Methylobacterium jeotgali]